MKPLNESSSLDKMFALTRRFLDAKVIDAEKTRRKRSTIAGVKEKGYWVALCLLCVFYLNAFQFRYGGSCKYAVKQFLVTRFVEISLSVFNSDKNPCYKTTFVMKIPNDWM